MSRLIWASAGTFLAAEPSAQDGKAGVRSRARKVVLLPLTQSFLLVMTRQKRLRMRLQLARGVGALGYFLGGYVPPGTPNWHPVLKKISPKIDTSFYLEMGQFFIPRSRIRPKTDTFYITPLYNFKKLD